MTKNITLITTADVGNESEAIRQALEYFGFPVYARHIGRPADFTAILTGEDPVANISPYWIISGHGEECALLMPTLSPEVYQPDEPTGATGAEYIRQSAQLNGQVVLTTACTLREKNIAQAFIDCLANAYIGPVGYVEGNAALLFIIRFFYELANGTTEMEAFTTACQMNEETTSFKRLLKTV